MKRDDFNFLMNNLQKRDEVLINSRPISLYNRYFDRMRVYARRLIDSGRQAEMLPLLESDNISYRFDAAGLLFHCYPEKCRRVLGEIAEMSVPAGLPKCYVMLAVSAGMSLEVGIPENYP